MTARVEPGRGSASDCNGGDWKLRRHQSEMAAGERKNTVWRLSRHADSVAAAFLGRCDPTDPMLLIRSSIRVLIERLRPARMLSFMRPLPFVFGLLQSMCSPGFFAAIRRRRSLREGHVQADSRVSRASRGATGRVRLAQRSRRCGSFDLHAVAAALFERARLGTPQPRLHLQFPGGHAFAAQR